MKLKENLAYKIVLPRSGRGSKEISSLLKNKRKETLKAIEKLKKHPTDFTKKGIEKLDNATLGTYTIRVTKSYRIFYDVDQKNKIVQILRCGKHDLYNLI